MSCGVIGTALIHPNTEQLHAVGDLGGGGGDWEGLTGAFPPPPLTPATPSSGSRGIPPPPASQ